MYYDIFKIVVIIIFTYVIYLKNVKYLTSFYMKFFIGIGYVLVLSVFTWKLSLHMSEPYKSILIILFSGVFLTVITKEVFLNIITNITISYVVSHILFMITSLISLIITFAFYWIRYGGIEKELFEIVLDKVIWETALIALVLEIIITKIIIKSKINISESNKKLTSSLGIFISGIGLVLYSLIRQETLSNEKGVLFVIGIVLCAVSLLYSFRKDIIIAYNDKVREIIEKNLKIKLKEIQDTNDSLENAAHRDAKQLPAYRKAVEELIKDTPDGEGKRKAIKLLNEIKTAEQEQSYQVYNRLLKGKILPSTGLILLDAIFAHMFDRTTKNNIDFDLIVGGDLSCITSVVTQSQLETLAADLIENAIIATKHNSNDYKKILVYLWMSQGVYELRVDDSGIPFEVDTFIQLGKNRVTTHSDTGGSGIGFMTIFQIIDQCGASLIITEKHTKSIAVRFDNKRERILRSYRNEQLIEQCNDGNWIIEFDSA